MVNAVIKEFATGILPQRRGSLINKLVDFVLMRDLRANDNVSLLQYAGRITALVASPLFMVAASPILLVGVAVGIVAAVVLFGAALLCCLFACIALGVVAAAAKFGGFVSEQLNPQHPKMQ